MNWRWFTARWRRPTPPTPEESAETRAFADKIIADLADPLIVYKDANGHTLRVTFAPGSAVWRLPEEEQG